MSDVQQIVGTYVSEVTNLEEQLVAVLRQTADEVAHVECFDEEQRAEVYTILEALKSDTTMHQAAIRTLNSKLSQGAANA